MDEAGGGGGVDAQEPDVNQFVRMFSEQCADLRRLSNAGGGGNDSSNAAADAEWAFKCCHSERERRVIADDGDDDTAFVVHYPSEYNVTRTSEFVSVERTWLRNDALYYNLYCLGLNTVFATALPFALLLFFNISTVASLGRAGKQSYGSEPAQHDLNGGGGATSSGSGRSRRGSQYHHGELLRRSNSPVCRRRENRLTRISLAIVWLFLFCHIWKMIPSAYEMLVGEDGVDGGESPTWMLHIQKISHALIVLNSSVNFLIYVML